LNSLVDLIHRILDVGISALFSALNSIGDFGALIVISLLSGVLLVFIYGKVSFQTKIRIVKRRIHAALLEVILFRHSPLLSLRAQARMLQGGLSYLLLAVPPILIMAVPCIFLMAQLQGWFGYEPLIPGSSTIVKASLAPSQPLESVSLLTDESVDVVGPLRNMADHELVWRVHPRHEGRFLMHLKLSDTISLPSELVVGKTFSRIDKRISSLLADKFLYPAHASKEVPKSILERFDVTYPERTFAVWGYHLHWVVLFLILSLLSGIAGGKLFKVEL
jgi:hypothetical protein